MTNPRPPRQFRQPYATANRALPLPTDPAASIETPPPTDPEQAPGAPEPDTARWLLPGIAAVLAIALIVVFAVGGTPTVAGQATPATDRRTVAETFATLESERYNDGTVTATPPPSAAAYASVSCLHDLAQMRGYGASPPPLASPRHLYKIVVASITPAGNETDLLTLDRTAMATGQIVQTNFTLLREAGTWRVCGLFADTQPSSTTTGGVTGPDATGGTRAPAPDRPNNQNGGVSK